MTPEERAAALWDELDGYHTRPVIDTRASEEEHTATALRMIADAIREAQDAVREGRE